MTSTLGMFILFSQEVISKSKHAPRHCLSVWVLGLVPGRYRRGPSLTFYDVGQFVRYFLGISSLGDLAGAPTQPYGPLGHDSSVGDDYH